MFVPWRERIDWKCATAHNILKAGGGPQRPSFLCLPKEKKVWI
jgi:hypothetical protein